MRFFLTLLALGCILFSYSQDSARKDSSFHDTSHAKMILTSEPNFPGGQIAWMEYISKNMQYPAKARNRRIQGVVIVQVVVDADGSLSDIKITDGPKLLYDESIRLVKNSGKWIPGKINGQAVKGSKKILIFYALEEVKKREVGDMNTIKY